jgi:hypothetical protein
MSKNAFNEDRHVCVREVYRKYDKYFHLAERLRHLQHVLVWLVLLAPLLLTFKVSVNNTLIVWATFGVLASITHVWRSRFLYLEDYYFKQWVKLKNYQWDTNND